MWPVVRLRLRWMRGLHCVSWRWCSCRPDRSPHCCDLWSASRCSALGRRQSGVDTNSCLIGAGTTDAAQLLLSLPVLVNVAVPPLTGYVIDKGAVVSAYGAVNVNTSDHQFFTSDSVAVRCTWRVGHNVVRPNRIGTFTIAGGGS